VREPTVRCEKKDPQSCEAAAHEARLISEKDLLKRGELHNIEAVSPQPKNGKRATQWASGVALNASRPDLRVTFLSQHDFDPEGNELRMFSWVTDLEVTPVNAQRSARAARVRWRIESETFNVMKNRGYHLEHNDGHGYQNLSTVLLVRKRSRFD